MFNIQITKISIIGGKENIPLIENCFLNIALEKIYILLGSNGTGKTTLALALTGLLSKDLYNVEGSVMYNNINLLNCDEDKLNEIRRNDIKYVFQDPVHSFNPLKKVGYYFNLLNTTADEINDMLNFFLLPGIESIRNLMPHEVSVGMAQRISLSLAFLAKPKIIIMDEPNSALDLAASNLLLQKMKEFTAAGSSILVITQDILFSQNAGNEIALLKDKTVKVIEDKSVLLNKS